MGSRIDYNQRNNELKMCIVHIDVLMNATSEYYVKFTSFHFEMLCLNQ